MSSHVLSCQVHRLRDVLADANLTRNRAASVDSVTDAIQHNPYRPTASYRHLSELPQEVKQRTTTHCRTTFTRQ